jgi:hypothetical protein
VTTTTRSIECALYHGEKWDEPQQIARHVNCYCPYTQYSAGLHAPACRSSTAKEVAMSAPAYRAYTVIKREGKEDYWLNLGVCFKHDDREGFNLLLQAMPLDGKIVLRTYKEREEEQQQVNNKSKYKK